MLHVLKGSTTACCRATSSSKITKGYRTTHLQRARLVPHQPVRPKPPPRRRRRCRHGHRVWQLPPRLRVSGQRCRVDGDGAGQALLQLVQGAVVDLCVQLSWSSQSECGWHRFGGGGCGTLTLTLRSPAIISHHTKTDKATALHKGSPAGGGPRTSRAPPQAACAPGPPLCVLCWRRGGRGCRAQSAGTAAMRSGGRPRKGRPAGSHRMTPDQPSAARRGGGGLPRPAGAGGLPCRCHLLQLLHHPPAALLSRLVCVHMAVFF